ncbi:MAG: fimbrial assembly chaperone [Proteobacteria bacterium]|nr:fimbrial assembly chaperone [Pseudomonadota bacterium]
MRNYKWYLVFSKVMVTCSLTLGLIVQANAVVNVDRTRVIFSARDIAQSLSLSNDGDTPVLVQVWTDTGDPLVPPDKVSTPIIVTPPVFKMMPQELRSLRLLLTARQGLSAKKESLFWLNVFQVQPENEQLRQAGQKVFLPLRLRLKVFVRPAELGAPDASQYRQLKFQAQGELLNIINPTAWYMSLEIQVPGQKSISNLMVSPNGNLMVKLSKAVSSGQQITYRVVMDNGYYQDYHQNIN